ncbi:MULTISPECIES: sugar ABC transporter substrate-binding protein [Pseudomonas]|jgi:inositol transport system substrate-binding protein|uniref:Sugar ABC transporter substrate-binding protein n=1 Tax=Pseudomonas bijieensis TaxID=2681983 RepID=A0A6N1CKJ5_9PSED|nr:MULTISPECIES: sugar ABC transporter substrate-binding protein [Pseudomonas]AXP03922.1 sugar ABC transporter substrate-binding protein [Pseudomonas fluorescens]MCD9113776.1 sugar ABC transporter substrate-binding protein [Pseudomonas bijieensis]PWJ39086.1 monosaccharide ABC transporter substrate-binding protein (CUT2 family) [Pseudomonas sp. 43mfcvi1.1]QIB07998.1 sugar ABC transporter substrate-binding protein [Pseudomonas fluorescens]QKS85829.1 sugar ABC transporter substrate-binding protei
MRRCKLLFATLLLLLSQWAVADYRIGVSIARVDDNFMTYVRNGLDAAAKKENVQIQFEDAQGDVVRQLNQVQGFINQKVDAVIVLPVDTSATANITRAAVEAKTPLVYVNRHPDERTLPKGVVTVASNDIEAGQLQMRYLAEKLGGKGNLAIIMGDLAQNATHDRTEGVKQVLKDYPGIKIVEQQSAEWQRNKGMDLTSNWLLAGSRFDAIVANNDEMAIGAAMALQQAGKAKGEIAIVGIDGLPDGLAAIKRGMLVASVFQDPKAQANSAVQAALKMIKGEPVETDVWVPFQLIKPEQLAVFEQHYK